MTTGHGWQAMPDEDAGHDRWMPAAPDPSKLTAEAVERATEAFQREIASLRELHDKDLAALRELLDARFETSGLDRQELWARIREIAARADTTQDLFRAEVERRDRAGRELIFQRLDDLDRTRQQESESTDRRFTAEREYVMARLETYTTQMQERFAAVDGRFTESRAAVDRALAAAKEAVAVQDKTTAEKIAKSDEATDKQISALSQVTDAGIAGLEDKIGGARDRITRIESLTRGIEEAGEKQRGERGLQHSSIQLIIAAIAVLIALSSVIVAISLHK